VAATRTSSSLSPKAGVRRSSAHAGRKIELPRQPSSRTVLSLVDFINTLDFDGASALAPAAAQAARATARLRRAMNRDGVRSIYANDNYGAWQSDFHDLWKRCSRAAGATGEMARALRPRQDHLTLLKPRHSAFYSTPLDLVLRELQCTRLILTGIAADSCVLFTAMDAYLRGYALWIPADCTAAESEESKRHALELMARVLKADIKPSREPAP
jgi:nicotinamidase-related amidase